MDLHMIVGKNAFYLYRLSAYGFEIEYVDGNPYKHYNIHSIRFDLENLLETVADTNNLNNSNEIKIILIGNSDPIRNKNVEQVLGNRIKAKISVNDVLLRAVKDLARNRDLHIGEFGINYDGTSYLFKQGRLEAKPYSLLAYNLEQEKLIEYV